MIRAIRPNAMAQDDAAMVVDWNIAPNVAYTLVLLPGSASCGVLLYDEAGSVLVASGAALVGTEQPCVLVPQTGQTVGMVDADIGWHLLLTTVGTESQRTIRVGPAVDLPDEIHPVYGEDDLALARATAAIDAAAHYIDDVSVTCPLGLGAGLGDVVSVPVDGAAVIGQVESVTWTGTPGGAPEQAVIRRHVAIAPEPFVEPTPVTPPTVADDEAETDAETATSGNVLTNDESGLTVVAVNGLSANVGEEVAGSDGGVFVIDEDGAWTFDPDGDFADLEGEETADTSVTYHVSDGTSEAMATLSLTVSAASGPELWTPAEIATGLWLDASDATTITLDSSAVSQWADKSGNNRHATQGASVARPTVSSAALNGLDVLLFDGSNDFLTLGTELGKPQNYTVFAVAKFTKALGNNQALILSGHSSGDSYYNWGGICNDGTQSGKHFWQYGNNSGYRWGYGAGAFTVGQWGQHVVRHEDGIQDESTWANGSELTNSGMAGTATAVSGTAYEMVIGKYGALNSWYFGGEVAEIVILLSAASTSDRQKVEGYLAHKWGLTAGLPSGHPYKSAPPMVE